MKKLLSLAFLIVPAAVFAADEALIEPADQGGFQLSLTPDIAIHSRDTLIKGFSLGVWSENPQKSLTLGLVNGSTGESAGFSWAFAGNYCESYTGVQFGFVNYSSTSFKGWQHGFFNFSKGEFTGLQSGWLNVSEEFHGCQFGLVNYAQELTGVQIGFVNVAINNPWFKEFPSKLATGFPFFNWSF